MTNIEEHIQKAIKEGQFDNLPGKGKPLKLDDNPHENPDWRLAYILLKNSGFSLPWLEARREIEEDLAQAQSELQRTWDYRQRALAENPQANLANDAWQRAVAAYHLRIGEINKRILNYNLTVPTAHFQMLAVDADRERLKLSDPPSKQTP